MNTLTLIQSLMVYASPAVLVAVLYRGCLSLKVFDDAPDRRIGWQAIDIFAVLMLLIFGAAMVQVAGGILGQMFGVHLQSAYHAATQPAATQAHHPLPSTADAWLGVVMQVIMLLPVAVYFIFRPLAGGHTLKQVGLIPRRPLAEARTAVLALLASLSLVMGTLFLMSVITVAFGHKPPEVAHQMLREMVQEKSSGPVIAMFVSAVVVAPIFEECLFRGVTQSIFVEMLGLRFRWFAILLTSGLFMLAHFNAVNWQSMPGLFVLAIVLGWTFERTGSIWTNIFIHAGFNVYNVALALWVVKQGTGKS